MVNKISSTLYHIVIRIGKQYPVRFQDRENKIVSTLHHISCKVSGYGKIKQLVPCITYPASYQDRDIKLTSTLYHISCKVSG